MYYGNASVIRSWNHFDSKRNIVYPGVNKRAHNTHTGNQVLTHLDTGINWGKWGFVIRPFDAFDYITQQESRYKEKGAGPFDLVVVGKTLKMIRNELGVSFGRCFVFDKGQITGDVKFSWVREHRLKGKDTTSAFTGTDVHFTVVSSYHSRNLFAPGVSISYKYNLFDLTAYYDGEFTHKYRDQTIGLQARFDF
jgi:outer membrane autotransporter protein